MNKEIFLSNFAKTFEDIPENLTMATVFRDIEGWSSIVGLSIIAMADEEYGAEIDDVDLKGVKTVGDIIELIQRKTNGK